jgi:hypothetical protein
VFERGFKMREREAVSALASRLRKSDSDQVADGLLFGIKSNQSHARLLK